MGATGEFEIDKGDGAGRFLLDESGKFKICGNCCLPCICGGACFGWENNAIAVRRTATLLDGATVTSPVSTDYFPGDPLYDDLIRFFDRSDWSIYGDAGGQSVVVPTPFGGGHLGWKYTGSLPPGEEQYADYLQIRVTVQDTLGAGTFLARRVNPTHVEGTCQLALCSGIIAATATAELRTSRWKDGAMLWQSVNAGLRNVFSSGATWPVIVNLYLVRRVHDLVALGVLHLGSRDGLFTQCGSQQVGGWPLFEFPMGTMAFEEPYCIPRCVSLSCDGVIPTDPTRDVPFLRGKQVEASIDVDYCSANAPYCWELGGSLLAGEAARVLDQQLNAGKPAHLPSGCCG